MPSAPPTRQARLLFAIAVIAAVAVKAFLLFVALPYFYKSSPTTYEAERFPDWYDFIASNLVEGHGYRFYPETTETMLRSPGWVLVLAAIFSAFGYSLTATKVANLCFSVATACLTYGLGRRVTNSAWIAALAALAAFFHPATLVADSRGGLESFFTLLIMLFMYLTYRGIETRSAKHYFAAGLALGLVLLTKSTPALFPPLLFLYLVGLRPRIARLRHAVVSIGAMALAAAIVLSPWTIRNYLLSGEFVPTMTVGGMAAYSGMYIATHRHTGRDQLALDLEASNEMGLIAQQMGTKVKAGYYPQFYNVTDETAFYRQVGAVVRARYAEQPALLLEVAAFNARGFWVQGRTAKATRLNTIIVLPFLALAAWGAWLGWRRAMPVGPILLFVASFFAAHVLILGQARYHVPLIPLLAILASIPLQLLLRGTRFGEGAAPRAA